MGYKEFDRSRWYGFEEPDRFSLSVEGARDIGISSAAVVAQWMSMNGRSLPDKARYLGLAAGQSLAELAFASHIGVNPRNTTLVDRTFAPYVRARLDHPKSRPTMVESGLYTYLDQTTDKFDIITAFGIEYVVRTEEYLNTLVALAGKVLNPEGYVVVVPCDVKFPNGHDWIKMRLNARHGLYLSLKGPVNPPKADEI